MERRLVSVDEWLALSYQIRNQLSKVQALILDLIRSAHFLSVDGLPRAILEPIGHVKSVQSLVA